MNVLDIGIILILIMGFIIGFKTGVMRELVSFIGIIIVFIISFELKGLIGNILCKYLPFFKFSGGIAGLPIINILIYQTIAFLLIFSISSIKNIRWNCIFSKDLDNNICNIISYIYTTFKY